MYYYFFEISAFIPSLACLLELSTSKKKRYKLKLIIFLLNFFSFITSYIQTFKIDTYPYQHYQIDPHLNTYWHILNKSHGLEIT